ncbi:hypothetical protein GXW82_38300 [Streptacidiphilus sp. 4-A2]|nr:hypothetical protein [Streptacidiphilus sp. 4-A2]
MQQQDQPGDPKTAAAMPSGMCEPWPLSATYATARQSVSIITAGLRPQRRSCSSARPANAGSSPSRTTRPPPKTVLPRSEWVCEVNAVMIRYIP